MNRSPFDSYLHPCYVKPMARPLRIDYPDAWYHAMNRGRRAEKIFAHKGRRGNIGGPLSQF
jgi:hypothetical protein